MHLNNAGLRRDTAGAIARQKAGGFERDMCESKVAKCGAGVREENRYQ